MNERIVLLGTGTCQIQEHRMASAILVELDDLRLVFDFGRGIAGRLATQGLRQDDVEHIVLSHFHPDHLSDLIPFLHAASWSQIDSRTRDLHVYGPAGLEDQISRMLDLFGPETLVLEEQFRVHLHEIRENRFEIGDRAFDFLELPPAGNHGLRFRAGETTCALTGDSFLHDGEIEFLRGVDLAVIDAGHISDDEIVELAVRTRVGKLVCSHLYREIEEDRLGAAAAKAGFEGLLIVGEDLMAFDLEPGAGR
jgi:ribonuclease BN (tRNA processing enzyme)